MLIGRISVLVGTLFLAINSYSETTNKFIENNYFVRKKVEISNQAKALSSQIDDYQYGNGTSRFAPFSQSEMEILENFKVRSDEDVRLVNKAFFTALEYKQSVGKSFKFQALGFYDLDVDGNFELSYKEDHAYTGESEYWYVELDEKGQLSRYKNNYVSE